MTIDRRRGTIRSDSVAFIAVLSMAMAATAIAIDSVLPAFGEIRTAFDLEPDAVDVTALITFYLIGNSAGLLPAGLLADRFGRKRVMWGGLVLYLIGVVGSILAPNLAVMNLFRLLWGLGAAGPRVAAMAMVRDEFDGDEMARVMSLMIAVFLIVPAVAPLVATGVLTFTPWWGTFAMCGVAALAIAVAVHWLPETLHDEHVRPVAVRAVMDSVWTVLTTRNSLLILAALSALFTAFLSYLASAELIVGQVFGLEEWFPVVFGALSLGMLLGMLLNSRVTVSLGLTRTTRLAFAGIASATVLLVVVALATGGTPPFVVFALLLAPILLCTQILITNLTSAGMLPLGGVAGVAAALLGMVPGLVGAIGGGFIDRAFDASIRPLAFSFAVAALLAWLLWEIAERRPVPLDAIAATAESSSGAVEAPATRT